jgi:hypothetical protein
MRTFVDVRCPGVIGRVAELAAIDAVITDRGGVVVVEGEPGIGKSRLAAAAAERARAAGLAVVSGRATPGATAAFRPLAEVLMALSRDGGLMHIPALAQHRGTPGSRGASLLSTDAGCVEPVPWIPRWLGYQSLNERR